MNNIPQFVINSIIDIVNETEKVQRSSESSYTKDRQKVFAYEEIMQLLKGEGVITDADE